MELRHLRYAVAVADTLHFGRAARALNISQPPLSQQIRDLERELGVTLFARTRRSVELTPAGHVFLERARRLLGDATALVDATRRAARGELGDLSIGFVHSAGYGIVPRVVRAFRRRCPEVGLRLHEATPAEQAAALEAGRIDLGLARRAEFGAGLHTEVILREPFLLALPRQHPAAQRAPARLEDFAGEPFIAFPRERAPAFHQALMGLCLRAGFAPRVTQEVNTIHTALGLVGAGIGIAMVPASAIEIGPPNVAFIPLRDEDAVAELLMIWRPERATPALQRFIACLRETVRLPGRPIRAGRPAGAAR